jgi:CRISPR-associated protein Cmr4
MRNVIMGMLAETALHPGTGQDTGVIDLPVSREKITEYPVIVGSSLKGALKDCAEQHKQNRQANLELERLFGNPKQAGAIVVTDGRLLLLPVRSLNSHYKWVTCPYLLERYQRDCDLAGVPVTPISQELPVLKAAEAAAAGKGRLYLEDIHFDIITFDPASLAAILAPLVKHHSVKARLAHDLVVVNDHEFNYFAKYALAINARNELDDNKISRNLWYEETIPPDTLFYSLLLARPGEEKTLASLVNMFELHPYLQVGGNETVGQGWCVVHCIPGGGDNDE